MQVVTDTDPEASFAGRTTYRWDFLPRDAGTGDPWVSSDFLARRVVEAVDRELAAKGYRRTAVQDDPDFLVDFHAAVVDVLEARETWTMHEGPAGAAGPPEIVRYKRGTLILDVVDPATGRQIWRGWAMDAVDERLRPEKTEPQIQKAIHAILARFPDAR